MLIILIKAHLCYLKIIAITRTLCIILLNNLNSLNNIYIINLISIFIFVKSV